MLLPFFADTYTWEQTLRDGENTKVYIVRHSILGELRIMKVVAKRPGADSSSGQISNEAGILSRLRFDGIPALYDAAEDDKAVCLIEEYFRGESLNAYLSDHMLSEKEVVGILEQVAGILSYLHTLSWGPLLYLDLKPEHIVVMGDRVGLIDYGISRVEAGSAQTFQNYGTRDYCSPEAADGRKCDVRSDIYSLGRLCRELYLHCSEKPSPGVYGVIERSLSETPEGRQESVAAWRDDYLKAVEKKQGEGGCLSGTIGVAGTERASGVTHIALALTVYLNRTGRKAVYINRSGRTVMENLAENDATFAEKADGLIHHASFAGLPERGPAAEEPPVPPAIRVVDCGTSLSMAYDADLMIHVVSSCPWKQGVLDSRAPTGPGTVIVLNPGRRATGIRMSKFFGQKVLGFPRDPDPFVLTGDKERFFRHLEKGL